MVKSFEAQEFKKRPFSVRLADILTSQFGTLAFLIINIIFFCVWIYANSGFIKGINVFDPYPFIFLTMTVSLEAIVLSIIVLISQKRESQTNSLRQELQLQVNLLTEREITKVLKVLKEIREGIKNNKISDEELEEMIQDVDTSYIERQLEEQIKESESTLSSIEKLLKR